MSSKTNNMCQCDIHYRLDYIKMTGTMSKKFVIVPLTFNQYDNYIDFVDYLYLFYLYYVLYTMYISSSNCLNDKVKNTRTRSPLASFLLETNFDRL